MAIIIDHVQQTSKRTIVVNAPGQLTQAWLEANIAGVQAVLRAESVRQIEAQVKLGNEVNWWAVDNTRGKGVMQAEKTVDVRFGTTIPVRVLRVTEQAVMRAVTSRTKPRTGALRDLSNWSWTFLRKGQRVPLINKAGEGLQFGPGDKLIFKPSLDYASIANNVGKSPTFLLHAARILRRNPLFSSLNVSVQSTKAYQVPGEKSYFGTRFIQITAKQGRIK